MKDLDKYLHLQRQKEIVFKAFLTYFYSSIKKIPERSALIDCSLATVPKEVLALHTTASDTEDIIFMGPEIKQVRHKKQAEGLMTAVVIQFGGEG